ncbi:helix-turn-helix domain-containing protein [Streptomyces sp. NBC_01530]|uniref:helix-turn-helix domain-containing protein n=1 Tax=Streptomyces sp. NBC_01530 TaxID=2903895 RepID=UPI0038697C38
MHSTPSDIIANQVRKRRRQLDMNRQQLAEKCASIGAPQITTAALTNIETGRPDKDGKRRREVSVEELLALAHALSLNPVDLMVPADLSDDEPYEVTDQVATTVGTAREWISGMWFLVPPESPMEFALAIQSMPQKRAQAVSRAWFTPERQMEWNRAALEYDRQPSGEDEGEKS